MAIISPISTTALVVSYTGTAAAFSATMAARQYFQFTASTACWIKQGTTPTAVAGAAGNIFVPLGAVLILDGGLGPDVSVVQDAAAGKATLAGVHTY